MINLTQWLCPGRHCSIALVWDTETVTEPSILARGEELFSSGMLKRVCGICNSTDIRTETGKTRFKTIEEAQPQLRILERANMDAKRIFQERKN
jgi:hypothetical protein